MSDSESALCKNLLDCTLRANWKDIEFNKNFMAKTNGVSITEFKYCGCVPDPDDAKDNESSENSYWHYMSSVHKLIAPERERTCFCTTSIKHNYVVFHPTTKQVVVVGSDCIERWMGGKLPKSCQGCGATYSGVLKFCKRCAQTERDEIKAAKDQVAWQDNWKIQFGMHRGSKWSYAANAEGYADWCLGLAKPSGKMVRFVEYLKTRRFLKEHEGLTYRSVRRARA